MKILQLDVHYGHSSTGKLVQSLTQLLRSRGHEVRAFYGRGAYSHEPDVIRIASRAEFIFHVLASRITGWNGVFSFFATRKFIRELNKFKPDVVHLHELHGYYLNIFRVMQELETQGIPIVWTFHCEYMYTGKCGYAMACEKWQTECQQCPQVRQYPKSWVMDFTRTMFKRKKQAFKGLTRMVITAPSEWLSRRVRLSMLAGRPVQTVFNGIDVDVFRPRFAEMLRHELSIPADAFIVLSVGADLLSPRKGGLWALQLANRLTHLPMVLVMVGVEDMPTSYPNNVRMCSPISDQTKLAQLYSLADVLLLTSEKETFSMVCAESLACGTPVMGFDSGAPKEVAPTGYGIFVPHADLDGLEKQLLAYFDDRTLLKRSEECVEFARQHYADGVMVSQFESLYKTMVDRQTMSVESIV